MYFENLLMQSHKKNVHKGAFNNYVDQILHNFDPCPSSGQLWTFDVIPTLCSCDQEWTFYVTPPPLLVYVVIECPLISYQGNTISHSLAIKYSPIQGHLSQFRTFS